MASETDSTLQRKQQLLEAATVVFAEYGFERATVDDIVAEAGLSKGTLYWYYDSKEDLITELLDTLLNREFDHIQSALPDDLPASGQLQFIVDLLLEDLKEMQPLLPILLEFLSLSVRRPAVKRALEGYMRRYLAVLRPVVQKGIDEGEFRALDVDAAAVAVGAIFEGTLLLWMYDSESVDYQNHIQIGLGLLLDGFRAKGTNE